MNLYASEALRKKGTSLEMAFFLPFLFNAQYEFKDLPGWPFNDPPASALTSEWRVRDIYAGYLAAMIGVGKGDQALKSEDFRKALLKSPKEWLRKLFYTRFDPKRRFTYR